MLGAIEKQGGQGLIVQADVADERAVARLSDQAEVAFGPVGALVDNAGWNGGRSAVADVDVEMLRRTLEVNVIGSYLCAREAVRRMAKQYVPCGPAEPSYCYIPVFHDDQHGTAIISAAALKNALEVAGKNIDDVRIVISGAGAAAMACLRLYIKMGLRKENVILTDSKGVIYKGRTIDMTPYKEEFAAETTRRTLTEALEGADVFVGLSIGGIVKPHMIQAMAKDPIVFAMANPDPEIPYDDAVAARPDVIMATGRSDYPNQVNNVLGFPFIFRGALDCRATTINDEMKLAASLALAELAKEEVPDNVLRAYSSAKFTFGREYLIPKPFDSRVLLNVPVAVARAAAETGVAQEPITDYDAYRRRLEQLLGRARGMMHGVYDRAKRDPKRIVFPEGDQEKIIRAAKILIDEGLAHPILLVKREVVAPLLQKHHVDESKVTIIDIERCAQRDQYVQRFAEIRKRHGVTRRRRASHSEQPQLLRHDDGRSGRCGRRDRRPARLLPGHDQAGAADHQDAPGREEGFRRVPADVQGTDAGSRRHDRDHRSRPPRISRRSPSSRRRPRGGSTSSRASP